jgi:hypothetical protein
VAAHGEIDTSFGSDLEYRIVSDQALASLDLSGVDRTQGSAGPII